MTRNEQQDLAGFVRATRTGRDMSYADVERASDGIVSRSTVWRIENSGRTKVVPRTLAGLSQALGVPVDALRRANGQTARVPREPFSLPDRANDLTAKQRRLVLQLIDGLLEAGGE